MLELQAEKREIFGKKLKPFRKKGKLPAVLYGPKEKSQPLFVSLKDFKKLWKEAGESTVIQLNLDKSRKEVLIQEVAMDPVKDEPVHVDFYAVQMDKPIQASVQFIFEGASPAVKNLGGVLVKVMHEMEVEALPKNLPHELVVDISKLEKFEDKILAKDIILPKEVKLISNLEEVVALVEEPKEEEVAPATEEKIAFEEIEVAGKKEEEKEERGEEGSAQELRPKEEKGAEKKEK
jgi:large subunit ribosomal protein L25